MKHYCEECGCLVAEIRDASIRKGTVMICKSCYYPTPSANTKYSDDQAVNTLKRMFGMS